MGAARAIYSGQESNEFYRRAPAPGPGLVASGGKQLDTGEVMLLGDDAIHAVTNPVGVPTGAIHVYGGDFVNQARSQWVPPDLVEEAYDMNVVREQFDRDHQHTSPA
jgi:predicted metal-dependent enzyme (double-stranded beta helix superfamily)